MIRYLVGRLASLILVLIASSIVVFGCLHLAPGDPAHILLAGRPATPQALENIRQKYALDKPLVVQYTTWASHILHGDLGQSIKGRDTVVNVLKPRLVVTLELTGLALVLILLIGLPLGIISGASRRKSVDVVSSVGALVAASIPAYVSGIILIAVFAVKLSWFPALGSGNGGLDTLYHLILPSIALALSAIALVSRITRVSLLDAMRNEFVETARIRGFSNTRVVLKHAFRSALVPVVTVSGVLIGSLLSGAVLVEYTFGLNGIGALLVSAVQGLDYAVVQAIALLVTVEFLVINLVVDLLYFAIDPRVRAGRASPT